MQKLVEQISARFENEQTQSRKAVNAEDIPFSYESITAKWLTNIICKDHDGASVIDFSLDEPDLGTTDRRRIFLRYNRIGEKAGLPASVFCKAAQKLDTRLLNAIGGLIQGEEAFYNRYVRLFDFEVPVCIWANHDRDSFNSIVILDDLERQGAEFCTLQTILTKERAQSQLRALATLHGKYYQKAQLHEATDLATFQGLFENIDAWLDWEKYCKLGFRTAKELMPPGILNREASMWDITLQSVSFISTLPATFTHNDAHLRNWYVAPSGEMALCDWQCFGKGHWSRDLAYALTTSLSVDQRKQWEIELIGYYLKLLHEEGGPSIYLGEAIAFIRRVLPSVLAFWTSTLGFQRTQPHSSSLELVKRIASAMEDHDSMTAFD